MCLLFRSNLPIPGSGHSCPRGFGSCRRRVYKAHAFRRAPPPRQQLNPFLRDSKEAPREVVTNAKAITALPFDPETELLTRSDGKGGCCLQESVIERKCKQAEEERKKWTEAGFSFHRGLGFVDTSEDEEESPDRTRATLSPAG